MIARGSQFKLCPKRALFNSSIPQKLSSISHSPLNPFLHTFKGGNATCLLSKQRQQISPQPQFSNYYSDQKFREHAGIIPMHGTTVLSVRKENEVVMIADGQVTMGNCVVKGNAKKLRRLGKDVIAGFAGSTADAVTLFERLEAKIDEYPGQLMRACVELAKAWRTDKYLRKLEALMIVADTKHTLLLTGNGDVLEPPPHGVVGIGSGGDYASAAARALMDEKLGLSAQEICERAMEIAADICIYTNSNFTKLVLQIETSEKQ